MQKIQLLAEACIRMTILKLELQNPMGGFLQHRLLGHAPSFDSEGAGVEAEKSRFSRVSG